MDNETNSSPTEQNESLVNYIRQQLRSGLLHDEISAQLLNAGWSIERINQVFLLEQAQVTPSYGPAIPQINAANEQNALNSQTPSRQPAQNPAIKRGRVKTGWLLLKQSMRVLKNNKGLVRYVLISTLFSVLLMLVFAAILIAGRKTFLTQNYLDNKVSLTPIGYLVAFIYYVLTYFIVNLYTAGLAANLFDLFAGKSDKYKHYMGRAWSKSGTLFMFSILEATIGTILRIIVERSALLGRIVAWILGALWSIARLFAIPIIMSTEDNAIGAIKRSTVLLKSTWGENIVGRASFGVSIFLIYLFLLIPASLGIILLSAKIGGANGAIIAASLVLLLFIVFGIIISAASSVLNTALYYYASTSQIPAAFDADLISNAFTHRKKRKGLFRRKEKQ